MARLTRQDIQIKAGFELLELTSLKVAAAVNAHATLSLSGKLTLTEANRVKEEQQSGSLIQLSISGNRVFSGFPTSLEIKETNEAYTIEAKAIGCSWQLAWKPRSYFYQHTEQSHQVMLEKAVEAARGTLIATQGKDKIGRPVLQYEQDAWAFSLRTAAMAHTVITPDISADYPQVCLGVPDGEHYSADATRLAKRLRFSRFRGDAQNRKTGSAEIGSYISHSLEDERIFRLGDRVTAGSETMSVMELEHCYTDSVFTNCYTLGYETDYALPLWENLTQTGLMLEGEVKAVSGDMVQVCLHIPDDAEEHGLSWFEYAPVTNNGMYAMPPVGTLVALQWMGPENGNCMVVRAVRDGAALPAYTQRSMITEYQKQLHMTPAHVAFFSDSNAITMKNGIQIKTGKRLKITAGKGVSIAGKRVRVETPEQVYIAKTGVASGIHMEGRRIHMKSENTQFHSSGIGEPLALPYREVVKPVALQQETVAVLAGMCPKRSRI